MTDWIPNLGKADSERAGERDAAIGVPLLTEHIISKIGPRPLEATQHLATRHQQAALALDTDEKSDQLKEAEDRAADHWRPSLLRAWIIALVLSEFAAIATLLRFRFGMATASVVLLSSTLTAGSILAARLAIQPTRTFLARIGGIALFATLTLSFALLRQDEAKAALGTDLATRLAATVLFVVMTIGPAVGVERLMHRLPESVRIWRAVRQAKSALRRDRKRIAQAERRFDRRVDQRESWDAKAERIRADYRRGYVHGRAKLGLPDNFDSPPNAVSDATEA